jgi:hypothetical protein
MALGSDASVILRMVREAASLVLVRTGIGTAGAVALSSVVANSWSLSS